MRITRLVKTIVSTMLCIFVLTCTLASSVKAGELSETGLGESDEVTSSDSNSTTNSDNNGIFENDGYTVTFTLVSDWGSGYQLSVTIDNTGNTDIRNWYLAFDYCGDITNIWNAEVYERNGNSYTVKNVGWNMDIPAGGSISFGISENTCFPGYPSNVSVMRGNASAEQDDYFIKYSVENEWNEGFVGNFCITNNSDTVFEDWSLEFDFDREISSFWNAVLDSCEGNHYVVRHSEDNAYIAASASVNFGFICNGPADAEPYNIILKKCDLSTEPIPEPCKDTDGDGLTDEEEESIGTDPEKADTDEDRLTDYQEIYLTWTDPTLYDTDENGVCDADEDLDGDGLTNLEELTRGTDLGNPDSDRDDLGDYDEIFVYGSDPLNPDSDGDTLTDGDDVLLGFSPLLPDTDGNGILDCDEKQYQTAENDFPLGDGRGITNVSVSMNVSGNIDKEVSIANIYDFDELSANVSGLVGVPIEINSNAEFDTALITFTYNEDELGDADESELSLMWYDEENHWFQILDEDSIVDTVNNTVSYTTTHFSKYLLVNKNIWFETWNAAVDYGQEIIAKNITGEKDFVFVVEESKTLNLDLIDSIIELEDGLRNCAGKGGINDVGKVSVETNVITWYQFNPWNPPKGKCIYYDKDAGDSVLLPYHGNNMDTVLKNAIYAFDYKPDLYKNDEKYIIIISNGDFTVSSEVVNACKEKGLVIYALDVDESIAANKFKQLAELTGGQYYSGELLNDPELLMDIIVNEVRYDVDLPDSDGDGLVDLFETFGMMCQNGTIIKTNPYSKDSDGDNLSDYQETGRVYCLKDAYIGKGIFKDIKLIVMSSDPTKADTDGDGLKDDVDPHPLSPESIIKEIKSNHGKKYIYIYNQSDVRLCGGNQGWWKCNTNDDENILEKYYEYVVSKDYRISQTGCGLIAMSDMEIYLSELNGYNSPCQEMVYYDSVGFIEFDDYKEYVEYNADNVYHLSDYAQNYILGVVPWDMVNGINNYLNYNGEEAIAIWAPSTSKTETINSIIRMIKHDIPVVFSYYDADDINLYYTLEYAQNGIVKDIYCKPTNSHYMTIIGYCRYFNEKRNKFSYILEVVSWGDIYYIDYDEYKESLSYLSNILEVK